MAMRRLFFSAGLFMFVTLWKSLSKQEFINRLLSKDQASFSAVRSNGKLPTMD